MLLTSRVTVMRGGGLGPELIYLDSDYRYVCMWSSACMPTIAELLCVPCRMRMAEGRHPGPPRGPPALMQ